MKIRRAIISGIGKFVPENVMWNREFEKFLDTSDEWISTRTGIKKRHIASTPEEKSASEIGAKAAKIALERAKCSPSEIDAIICATFTPDNFFPSTACNIQKILGCNNASAFDISAACTGFVYGLTIANSMIVSGQCKKILLVGSEVISKTLDWSDRSTCILFGDGAGAVVVESIEEENRGLISCCLKSDGRLGDILVLPAWGEKRTISMKGNEVFKHAVRMMTESTKEAIKIAGLTPEDIDYFIPHQANKRIILAVGEQLKLNPEKVICNVENYGNTSSASIPIALDELWSAGKIHRNTKVVFTGLGGGITVGSVVSIF
ncbi:MAG: ketoacyl-ACP synthase III [Chitinispirillaceae bacterium]|nr:ketoacyl-ACP synthase III [Chitinispirillaceae bacterium]